MTKSKLCDYSRGYAIECVDTWDECAAPLKEIRDSFNEDNVLTTCCGGEPTCPCYTIEGKLRLFKGENGKEGCDA